MPIYEYQCSNCHHHFDLIQKMNDEPVKTCPTCSKDTAVRLVSAAGFQLKGTGWYATDFKNKGSQEKTSGSATKTGKSEAIVSDTTGSDKKSPESSGSSTTSSKESN